jgi:hypothetical protein
MVEEGIQEFGSDQRVFQICENEKKGKDDIKVFL